MRNNFSSYISTRHTQISVHRILDWLESERIELYSEYSEPSRITRKKKSKIIESLLLGIPLNNIWIEQDHLGSSVVIKGLDILETIKSFINDEFRLTGLRYFHNLEGSSFRTMGHSECDILLSSGLQMSEVKYDAHPRLKCEFFRNLHHDNRQKNISQLARNYAFKNAYKSLRDYSHLLMDNYNFSMSYQDPRDSNKNEARVNEFILTVILMIVVSGMKYNRSHRSSYHDNFLSSEVIYQDYIDIALDKVMMSIDSGEISINQYFNDIENLMRTVLNSLQADSIGIRDVFPRIGARTNNKTVSLTEMLNFIHKEIYRFKPRRDIFSVRERHRDNIVKDLFE